MEDYFLFMYNELHLLSSLCGTVSFVVGLWHSKAMIDSIESDNKNNMEKNDERLESDVIGQKRMEKLLKKDLIQI